MAQLSRTYQVILVLVAVLALAWFTVLHNQISSNAGGSSSSGAAQGAHSSSQGAPGAARAGSVSHDEGAPTRVYHGPVPGLHGLSKDIRRAHEAVSTSDAQSRRLESAGSTPSPSAQGNSSAAATAQSAPARSATKTSSPSTHGAAATGGANRSAGTGSSGAGAHAGHADSRAVTVSRQLRQGKVVLLLFWNSKSFDDQAVHAQVQAASRSLRRVAADFAKPSEVGAFGTVTADVRVLQTPTLLVINQKGLTTTITGLTDAFSIEQAVREAR